MTPHLVWSASDDQPPPGLDHRPVRLRLQHVGRGEPGVRVHAVHAHDHEVHVDGPQRGHRERAHERVRRRAHAAGEDDGLVRPAAVVQDVRDRHGVGDHRQLGHLESAGARRRTWSCPRTARWRARLDQPGGGLGDRPFSSRCSSDLAEKPGSNSVARSTAVAPPWTFSSSPCSWSSSRSRRTVMSETPSSRTRSATRTPRPRGPGRGCRRGVAVRAPVLPSGRRGPDRLGPGASPLTDCAKVNEDNATSHEADDGGGTLTGPVRDGTIRGNLLVSVGPWSDNEEEVHHVFARWSDAWRARRDRR